MSKPFVPTRAVQAPPAHIGAPVFEVDTPALIVDLDVFERNMAALARAIEARPVRLRPHAKTHKCVAIARRQMAAGAVGVCCQKVSEAEIFVEGGVPDVLVANEVVGRAKLQRLAILARKATIGVCVDDLAGVGEVGAAAAEAGVRLDCLVEIDVGGARCGAVGDDEVVRIAAAIGDHGALRFAGIQAYNGASQHIVDPAVRRDATLQVADTARRVVERLKAAGLACETVTGAGTGTVETALASGAFTEIQPGSYVFMDRSYAAIGGETGGPFDRYGQALFVLATVMSAAAPGRAVVDAGHKATSIDSGMPGVWNLPGCTYERPSDEHGVLVGERLPRRGERILLVPGHCDPTVNLHDWLVGVRDLHTENATAEEIWAVNARGALF
jgi:3-hydroxy-D-aspartate aldolase